LCIIDCVPNAEKKYGRKCKTEEENKGIIMAENSKESVEQTVSERGGSALSHTPNGYVFHPHKKQLKKCVTVVSIRDKEMHSLRVVVKDFDS